MPAVDENGQVSPPTPTPAAKKSSGVLSALKWLGGGMVLGIAGYEGLKMWKRLKGDAPADPLTELNPAPAGGAPAPLSIMPQMMPFPMPMPMPYPLPSQQQAPAPAPAPAPDPVGLNPSARRSAKRAKKTEDRLAYLESLMQEYDD